MSTLNRTFSVKNGIDVANTVVLDGSRNASNLTSVNANSFFTVAGLDITLQANTARTTANDAYAQANTANNTANGAYFTANVANTTAKDAYAQANSARSAANSAANTVRVSANGGSTLSGKQLNFSNTASIQVSVSDGGDGNAVVQFSTTGAAVADAYAQANAAYGQANAAYSTANTANTTAKDAYAAANTAGTNALNAYGQANAAYAQANAGYSQANAAYAQANNAYAEANLKLNLSGGTVSGNLTIQGNLFLTGNATYINTTSIIANDSILQLASNNNSDAIDIGIVGHYNANNYHTGLIRHASDKKYYLFDGYGADPANNIIDIAVANTATLVANLQANSITLVGNTVATAANTTAAYNQANAAYGQANAAYSTANTANTNALNAYAAANTANTNAINAYGQANAAYGAANTANTNALNAYAAANNRVLKAGDTMTGALTISTSGIGLSVANANVTYSLQVGTLNVTTNTVTTASSGQVVLDKFPATQLASVKYFVQANSATDYHTTEIVLVQDTTNVYLTEYGSIQTGPSLGTFSADINSGDVRLLFTAVNSVNTIRSVRYGIIP